MFGSCFKTLAVILFALSWPNKQRPFESFCVFGSCFKTLAVILFALSWPNKQRPFESFVCLDLVLKR